MWPESRKVDRTISQVHQAAGTDISLSLGVRGIVAQEAMIF